MRIDPLVLAQFLTDVWQDMGAEYRFAPPEAWIEIAQRLQAKIVAGMTNADALPDWRTRNLSLAELRSLCILLGCDPKQTTVAVFLREAMRVCVPGTSEAEAEEMIAAQISAPAAGVAASVVPEPRNIPIRAKLKCGHFGVVVLTRSEFAAWQESGKPERPAVGSADACEKCDPFHLEGPTPIGDSLPIIDVNGSEPRPPFGVAGVRLVRDERRELIARYGRDAFRTGYYQDAAQLRDPTLFEVDGVTTGKLPLLALLPITIITDDGIKIAPDYRQLIRTNPDYYQLKKCSFCNRNGMLGAALRLPGETGLPICPPCIARLVGRIATARASHVSFADPSSAQGGQAKEDGGNDAAPL